MSEREQLREALAEALAAADAEQFGYEVTSDYEGADAVLAVLDQQGWPQDCPTVEAADLDAPSSPSGTPHEMTPDGLRQIASWFDTYDRLAEAYIDLTSDKVSAERAQELLAIVRGKGVQDELRRWADDLREAARYEPIDGWRDHPGGVGPHKVAESGSCELEPICGDIYRRVTEGEEG